MLVTGRQRQASPQAVVDWDECQQRVASSAIIALTTGVLVRALEAARHILNAQEVLIPAGATCPNPRVVVVRALAPQVEPAMNLLKQIWACWRAELWQLPSDPPRIWAM